ncbi:MAG: GTP 3',8-cyclase MoaA [Deltaproteobacteria bacterium]|nr:GTP 3',8-cyclase MoaA [Deltaproteobacteria bacterium]
MAVRDAFDRPLGALRLSVTDRCNLRCRYCMPAERHDWLPRSEILSFAELCALVDVFVRLGVGRVRITGGEPLLRRDLPTLVAMLAAKPAIRDLALTTNGLLLGALARPLRAAGLGRITVSLDTLRVDRFERLTRRDGLGQVLAGLEAARKAGFSPIKLDALLLRGINDDEIFDLLELARSAGAELRFIEYMDMGDATGWRPEQVVPQAEILARVQERYGAPLPFGDRGSAPAARYRLGDGLVFGVVSGTSAPFCTACDRGRLTAGGMFYGCLYATQGTDLKAPLRAGASAAELAGILQRSWTERRDRSAEERWRRQLAAGAELGEGPRVEMHERGG